MECDHANILTAQGIVNQLQIGGVHFAVADGERETFVSEEALGLRDVTGNVFDDVSPGSLFAGYVNDGQAAPAYDADTHRSGQSLAKTNVCSRQPIPFSAGLRRGDWACNRFSRFPGPQQIVATFTINQKRGTWNRAERRRVA